MNVPASQPDSIRRTRLIIIFAAILALTAALLLGGFYFAKYRGEQAANPGTAEVKKPDSNKGENAPVGEPEEKPSAPSTSTDNDGSRRNADNSDGSNPQPAVDNLPSSGPTENAVLGALMIGVVAYTLVRYVQSRNLRNNA